MSDILTTTIDGITFTLKGQEGDYRWHWPDGRPVADPRFRGCTVDECRRKMQFGGQMLVRGDDRPAPAIDPDDDE